MTCHVLAPGVIVCTRGKSRGRRERCNACGEWAGDYSPSYQCDWKLSGERAGSTCSAWLCERCAFEVAKGKHLCPPHRRMWDAHPRNPNRKGPTL